MHFSRAWGLRFAAGAVVSSVVSRNGTTDKWILDPVVTLASRQKPDRQKQDCSPAPEVRAGSP